MALKLEPLEVLHFDLLKLYSLYCYTLYFLCLSSMINACWTWNTPFPNYYLTFCHRMRPHLYSYVCIHLFIYTFIYNGWLWGSTSRPHRGDVVMSRTAPWGTMSLSQWVSQTLDFSITMTKTITMNTMSTVGSTNELLLPDFPHKSSQVLRTN